jgi:dsRNA-specific ribonuclease
VVEARIQSDLSETAEGRSIKAASQSAAARLLDRIGQLPRNSKSKS